VLPQTPPARVHHIIVDSALPGSLPKKTEAILNRDALGLLGIDV
jgi:hypothetical protein